MTGTASEIASTAPIRNASPGLAMARFVGNAFQMRGRASGSEYWWWMLVNLIVLSTTQLLIPVLVSGATPQATLFLGPFGSMLFANIELFTWVSGDPPSSAVAALSLLVAGLWLLVTLIPGLTVAIRRLHDSNLAGWWVLLAFIPIGPFVLLILATRRPRWEGARFDQ